MMKIKTPFISIILAAFFFFGCGDLTFPSPLNRERTIGGTTAESADASIGYLAGGGDCGDGGNAIGMYCVETSEGTSVLLLNNDKSYEVRFSVKQKDCKDGKNYENYGGEPLASGTWETLEQAGASYIIFTSGECSAAFEYSANYFGISLCKPAGEPEEVGLIPGEFPRLNI